MLWIRGGPWPCEAYESYLKELKKFTWKIEEYYNGCFHYIIIIISECSESHTVKEDLESLCQSFQAVQQRFAQFIDKLEGKQTTDVEKKDIIDKDLIASTDNLKTTAVEEKETANIVDSYKDSSDEKLNVISDKNVSDHSGKELSEENSDNVKDSDEKENDVKNNYEECTVNLTLTIPR